LSTTLANQDVEEVELTGSQLLGHFHGRGGRLERPNDGADSFNQAAYMYDMKREIQFTTYIGVTHSDGAHRVSGRKAKSANDRKRAQPFIDMYSRNLVSSDIATAFPSTHLRA